MDKKKKSEELFKVIKEITFKKEEKGKRVKVTLGETSEYLENLLDYASAPIIVWNPQYEIIRFNKAFESLTGRTEKDVIGKSLEILFPPALRDCSMELIKNTIIGDRLEAVEINIVHTGGSVFTLLWNSAPIKSSNGKTLIATIAQGQDITQRKQAEELIKENEKRFRELLESLPQLFWTCRADGFCDYLSNQWVKYTGIPEAEQLGYRWLEQLHEEDKERTNAVWGEKVKTGDDFNIEFRIRRNDGVYHWFKTRAIPMRDAEGNIIKWFGSNTDFDEIKKAEEEIGKLNLTLEKKIKQSEQRAAELVIANKELAFQNEEKGKRADELIIANKELAFQNREKEKRADELIMANKELAFQNEEKEKRSDELITANKELAFQNIEKEKRAVELIIANKELVFQNREKEKRSDELILANKELAFQNEEKEKRAAELIIANKELVFQNSEKKKRADELALANKELAFQNEEKGKRADELALANKELAFQNKEKEKRAAELIIANKELAFQVEVNKVLEQFTYVVSHNLQEPLRTVSNYIQVLNEDYSEILDDKARKYLHLVDDSTKRMSTLLSTLSDISRLGRNIKLSQVDCKKVVDEVIADLATLIKTSNAKIEVTDMPVLNAYEVEMRQLFQNLITNAIKFRRKNTQPEIQIRSEKINEKWKFSVSDNGIGIAPVHFQRIFDIFQRLHTDAEYEGNGIGLSNCKKIVQLHHGEIWIESNIGQGSTFHFTIPNLAL